MSQGLREITSADWYAALEGVLLPKLVGVLNGKEAGHCMRVTDLDRGLMVRLAGSLRAAVPTASVVILADEELQAEAAALAVSSTKLVELRNPLPSDELRPPLLVFVPNDLRAAAEDSFGVATFEEVSIDGAYGELIAQLLSEVPPFLRGALEAVLHEIRRVENRWRYADDSSVGRYLLTGKLNNFEPDAMGAALCELALIPDFELFSQPEHAPARAARNRECIEAITWSTRTERARALELGLQDAIFCKELGEFFARVGVTDPRELCLQIVRERANWRLAFNRWVFEDGGVNPASMFIGDVSLPDLPTVTADSDDSRLAELIGHRILPVSQKGLKKFGVSFRVDPVPSKITGLSRFVAEVVSKDNGPTGLRRRKAAWGKPTDTGAISFTSIGKIDWEEGWHFVRVYGETEDGDRIPLLGAHGNALQTGSDVAEMQPNESDLFYVLTEDDVEVEPPQRAVPRDASLMHAWFRARFSAVSQGLNPASVSITGVSWIERSTKAVSATSEMLEVRLGKEGKAHVYVPGILADLERAFLNDVEGTNRLSLQVTAAGIPTRTVQSFAWPKSDEARRFQSARASYFSAIVAGEQRLITQAANLLELHDVTQDYAAAYLAWIDSTLLRADAADTALSRVAMEELRCALTVDTVAVLLEDYQGQRRDALLIGPTHPLRANWYSAWARLGQLWLEKSQLSGKEFVIPTRDAILKQLAPAGFPPVLPFGGELGRTALAVDNLNPFWSLYAAADERDPRGLVGEVCAALGVPEPAIGGAAIDSAYLAARVFRYLIQHPYVRTLTINAFNAGRASALAEVLLALQRQPEFVDLRYDVRLFVFDPGAPATGEALLELLSPDSGTSAKEADAFSTPTESHLHPKLRLAIRSIREFRDDPSIHAAHLTFLFDLFPAEEIRAIDVGDSDDASFVHGLIQPFAIDYEESEESITWLRRPLHGMPQAIDGAEALSDLLGSMAKSVSIASAAVARSEYLPRARPVVALNLNADERAMLHQVHEFSDWVLTIDRNLGIEFFDHRRHATRPDYLIDHSPDMANAMSHRLAITSRSVAELESLLVPILNDYSLPSSGKHAVVMLDQLRSLSGRLALKLLSSSSQRAEAMGLALSRLFLEHQGVFQSQIVVPLDAHLDLYDALRQNSVELGDEVSFRRTDLALFDLDPTAHTLTCRLVEVKCYNQIGDLSAYEKLKISISEQIAQTEQVIRHHFDPRSHTPDRPDRAIKNRDLAALLGFYLDRSERYGIVLSEAAREARFFLRHLDENPYELLFTRSAVVFDFSKTGTEAPDIENGIEYYRIGRDLISQLVESAVIDSESSATLSSRTPAGSTQELIRRRSLAPAVPTYESAAFLSLPRDRTSSRAELAGEKRVSAAPSSSLVSQPAAIPTVNIVSLDTTAYQIGEVVAASDPTVESLNVDSENPKQPITVIRATLDGESSADGNRRVAVTETRVPYDIMLGASDQTPQYGLLGEVSGRKVALDLNQTHTISLFGVQGGGKSYTLGSIAEMASLQIAGINQLPEPLSTVIFHYSPTMDYKPEFTSMVGPNSVEDQIRTLRETYGATPKGLTDVVLLVPASKLNERQADYPDIEVLPLEFASSELKASHWKFLMGAVGNQATYIRQIMRIMKGMRDDISLSGLRAGIEASSVPDHLKELAKMRLDLAAEYINDSSSLSSIVRPGRLIIVDLRDEFIEKDEALGLFVVLLQLFADARIDGRSFNKLVVFDEAHKYIESPDLVAGLIEVVREMRHKGVSIMVASQDPPSVPVSLIELSSQIIMHKFNSPAWLKHIQKANAALSNLTPERMASLKAGEAYVWSSRATDESFSKGAVKLKCRPRVTQHGGATKLAVKV
jgi:DNA phosphorothioation-dependent restriction protein DptH